MPGIIELGQGPTVGERIFGMALQKIGLDNTLRQTELQAKSLELDATRVALAEKIHVFEADARNRQLNQSGFALMQQAKQATSEASTKEMVAKASLLSAQNTAERIKAERETAEELQKQRAFLLSLRDDPAKLNQFVDQLASSVGGEFQEPAMKTKLRGHVLAAVVPGLSEALQTAESRYAETTRGNRQMQLALTQQGFELWSNGLLKPSELPDDVRKQVAEGYERGSFLRYVVENKIDAPVRISDRPMSFSNLATQMLLGGQIDVATFTSVVSPEAIAPYDEASLKRQETFFKKFDQALDIFRSRVQGKPEPEEEPQKQQPQKNKSPSFDPRNW